MALRLPYKWPEVGKNEQTIRSLIRGTTGWRHDVSPAARRLCPGLSASRQFTVVRSGLWSAVRSRLWAAVRSCVRRGLRGRLRPVFHSAVSRWRLRVGRWILVASARLDRRILAQPAFRSVSLERPALRAAYLLQAVPWRIRLHEPGQL